MLMNCHAVFIAFCSALLATWFVGSVSVAVTFEWATVDNPGNDPTTTRIFPEGGSADVLIGGVDYTYQISKHEVTNAQYAEFLNAVDPTAANPLELYNPEMAGTFGGIELQPTADEGGRYVTRVGRESNPVSYISWFDATRFVNWLENGQGSGSTETGVYEIENGFTETRSGDADYFLPTASEWYKAAYHDASQGTAGVYFEYANGSDSRPISSDPNDNPAGANYYYNDQVANGFDDGFATVDNPFADPFLNPFTDVGAYNQNVSPYGTYDQNGNVYEWTETSSAFVLTVNQSVQFSRTMRGGGWVPNGSTALSNVEHVAGSLAGIEHAASGFRVASKISPIDLIPPEPQRIECPNPAACSQEFDPSKNGDGPGGGIGEKGDLHLSIHPPDVNQVEEITELLVRVDFGPANVPTAVTDEQYELATKNATPGEPILAAQSVNRVLIDMTEEQSHFSFGAHSPLFGIDYTGDPDNFLTWIALTPIDVVVEVFTEITTTEFYTETTTQYFLTTVLGDYNFDGTVNSPDYNIWRDNFGSTTELDADGNTDGRVNTPDYNVWRDNFGDKIASSAAGVPEPSSFALLVALTASLLVACERCFV